MKNKSLPEAVRNGIRNVLSTLKDERHLRWFNDSEVVYNDARESGRRVKVVSTVRIPSNIESVARTAITASVETHTEWKVKAINFNWRKKGGCKHTAPDITVHVTK